MTVDPSQPPSAWSYATPASAPSQAQAAGSVASGLPWPGGSLASISLDIPQLKSGDIIARAPPRGKHAVNAAAKALLGAPLV